MKKTVSVFSALLGVCLYIIVVISNAGCANIIPPSGGPRDSLPPVLITATPRDSATNFPGNRITLTFDEYVTLDNALENVLVSPVPKNNPVIDYKLKNVTVKLRDTLEPNTTYSLNFGNAIKDVNEGNVFKDFTYIFSTGSKLDDNTLSGKVTLAESGKFDSTLVAVLYPSLYDSAVAKEKPRYIARVDGQGNFGFANLPTGRYALYAIPKSFTLRYDDTTRPFAFANQPVELDSNLQNVQLYAYSKPKPVLAPKSGGAAPASKDKQLRFSANLQNGQLDFLDPLQFDFNRPLKEIDTTKISLVNEKFEPFLNWSFQPADTNQTKFIFKHPWQPNTAYNIIFQKEAFTDTLGVTLAKIDTIQLTTKKEEDYGSLKIRFNNLDLSKNPVVQLVQSEVLVISDSVTQRDWYRKLVKPGSYEIRILYDTNKNGQWDTGEFFGEKRQPEIVVSLDTSIDIRSNWDNEKEITLRVNSE